MHNSAARAIPEMTILVDEARWPWRGRLWAHLVSDESLEELHAFAAGLGLRRLAFQGDHYDVDSLTRASAIELGAAAVTARQLVRRLRDAGLRRPRGSLAWSKATDLVDVLDIPHRVTVQVLLRDEELAVVIDIDGQLHDLVVRRPPR